VARELTDGEKTRRVRFEATWHEDLPASETFKRGDLIEVEGRDLVVEVVQFPMNAPERVFLAEPKPAE
jgi:hypothetical protein